jgi:hypothetical protein
VIEAKQLGLLRENKTRNSHRGRFAKPDSLTAVSQQDIEEAAQTVGLQVQF